MICETISGAKIDGALVKNYFSRLIDLFFKILPMYETGEASLNKYMEGLRDEMAGFSDLITCVNYDAMYLSLMATLQFLIGEVESADCTKDVLKNKVFGAISLCNKLSQKYGDESL